MLFPITLMGCTSSNMLMEDSTSTLNAKKFNPPPSGKAGIYIFRDDGPFNFDKARFKRRLWIDSTCIGKSEANVFYHTHVSGGTSYTFGTESVLLINNINVTIEAGKNYFFEQFVQEEYPFKNVGRTTIRQVPNFIGESKVRKLNMASPNSCE